MDLYSLYLPWLTDALSTTHLTSGALCILVSRHEKPSQVCSVTSTLHGRDTGAPKRAGS